MRCKSVTLLIGLTSVAFAGIWAFLRAGPAVTPSLNDLIQAANNWPKALPDDRLQYLSESPIGHLLFLGAGFESSHQYLLLSVIAIFAFIALTLLWMYRIVGLSGFRPARLFLLSPIIAVLFNWIGQYDAFTMLAWCLFLFAWASPSKLLLILSGVILGFQHFEQSILGLTALALIYPLTKTQLPNSLSRNNPSWAFIGIIMGKLLLGALVESSSSVISGRSSWVNEFIKEWTIIAVSVGPTLLWSLFAGSWAVVIAYILKISNNKNYLFLIASLGIGVFAMLLSGDRPRVFAIVMAPTLIVITSALLRSTTTTKTEFRIVESMVWIGVPIFLWGADVVYTDALSQTVMTVNAILNHD